ncbi:ZIP family metal transporter [Candidatus Woesearchaeota archaeon]|nr:ZIP family metal transporter [Candidatus Woesearchaeota archaeon]
MATLLWILLSTFVISAFSLIGLFTLLLKEKSLNKITIFLVSLSAGALIGGAFLDLIPEAVEHAEKFNNGITLTFVYLLVGFSLFFLIEKVLHWRHCHDGKCEVHTFAYMNLFGDCVHNFIDGLIIAASFVVSTSLGITTSLAIMLHEIPQEIGDFGVLIHGGFTKSKALLMNFLTALTSILGGVIGYFLYEYTIFQITFLIPFAAGGFIYIAASDLIPEIRKEIEFKKYLVHFGIFLLGILIIYGVKLLGE